MTETPVTAPPCPACAGSWLYGFTFDHRLDCRIRDAEDATRAADLDRISVPWPLTRPSTAAELELSAAFDASALTAEPVTIVRHATPGVLVRVVAGVDPDQLITATTGGTP
jgi:hypothetical protein